MLRVQPRQPKHGTPNFSNKYYFQLPNNNDQYHFKIQIDRTLCVRVQLAIGVLLL